MVSAVSNAKIHGFVLRFSKKAYPDLPTVTGEKIHSLKAKKNMLSNPQHVGWHCS